MLAASPPRSWYAEARAGITCEVSASGARSPAGDWAGYPLTEHTLAGELVLPAPVSLPAAAPAQALARSLADGIDATGLLTLHLLAGPGSSLLISDIILGPDPSTLPAHDAAATSPLENHLRAILGWSIGPTQLTATATIIIARHGRAAPPGPQAAWPALPGVKIHRSRPRARRIRYLAPCPRRRSGAHPAMTSQAWHSGAARDEPSHETAREPVPAETSVSAPALPSRPVPARVHPAKWVPPDPETLRRVKAAFDRL